MEEKVKRILESKGIDTSKKYHYSLLYKVKPDLTTDNQLVKKKCGEEKVWMT